MIFWASKQKKKKNSDGNRGGVDLQHLKKAVEAILVHVLPFSPVETQTENVIDEIFAAFFKRQ